MKRLPIYLAIAIVLTGCSQTRLLDAPQVSGDQIVFGSHIDAGVKSKVGDGDIQFTDGETIGVLGYSTATVGETFDMRYPFVNVKDFTFTAADGGKFTSSSAAAYWQSFQAHTFYAYYPSSIDISNSLSKDKVTVTLDVAAGTGAKDFMLASVASNSLYDGSAKSAMLNFKHKLSKVKFKIIDETGLSPNLSAVEFKMAKNQALVDFATGTVTNSGQAEVFLGGPLATPLTTTATAQDVPGGWIVLPGDQLSEVTLTLGGKIWRLTGTGSTLTTEPGKINVITLKVRQRDFTMTVEVKEWDDAPVSDISADIYSLSVDQSSFDSRASAFGGTITYTSNYTKEVTATTPDSWITVGQIANSAFNFMCASNPGAARTGTINVTAGRIIKKVTVKQMEPVVINYGYPPYDKVGSLLKGYTYISRNSKYGAGKTNGAYQADDAAAYLNEKPIWKFEVAPEDAYNGADKNKGWAALQGTAEDRLDNICVKVHGEGWRLPRLSEMRLIYENKVKLNDIRMLDAISGSYWSATEVSGGSNALSINFDDGTTSSVNKTLTTVNVRCVKEVDVIEDLVIEYGKGDFPLYNAAMTGATTKSYNGFYGENKTNPGTNGMYRSTLASALANEKPYYRFEVSKWNTFNGGRNGSTKETWRWLQGSELGHGYCRFRGPTWRIPRISELMLIDENKVAMKANGLVLDDINGNSSYWSATEIDSDRSWRLHPGLTDPEQMELKTRVYENLGLKCVREF